MIIKVCGIKSQENISFLSKANIDMVGLNFYSPSIRYISDKIDPSVFDQFNTSVKRVGVFVNENQDTIFEISRKFKLDYIQLHGDEDSKFCDIIAEQVPIIKVFRIDEKFDFATIRNFTSATYFLFDTQTKQYGGSGKKFNWEVLIQYNEHVPFLLSGGIGPSDYPQILEIAHPRFAGIDINSKFEIHPGSKDKNLTIPFIETIKTKGWL